MPKAQKPKAQTPKTPKTPKAPKAQAEIKEDTVKSEGIRGYKAVIITVGLVAFIYVVVDSRLISTN